MSGWRGELEIATSSNASHLPTLGAQSAEQGLPTFLLDFNPISFYFYNTFFFLPSKIKLLFGKQSNSAKEFSLSVSLASMASV